MRSSRHFSSSNWGYVYYFIVSVLIRLLHRQQKGNVRVSDASHLCDFALGIFNFIAIGERTFKP